MISGLGWGLVFPHPLFFFVGPSTPSLGDFLPTPTPPGFFPKEGVFPIPTFSFYFFFLSFPPPSFLFFVFFQCSLWMGGLPSNPKTFFFFYFFCFGGKNNGGVFTKRLDPFFLRPTPEESTFFLPSFFFFNKSGPISPFQGETSLCL